MSRLQKKCFMGATGVHLLLLLALFVGPGFFTKDKPDNSPILEFVSDKATDDETKDPGKAGTMPPAVPVPVTQPVQQQQPTPPTPPPKQVERVEPTRVEPPKETKQSPVSHDPVSDKPKTREVKISDKVVKISKQQIQNDNAAANAKAQAERNKQLAAAISNIKSGFSSSTEIKLDGPVGNGGAGLARYGDIVRKRYNDAWVMPTDLSDDDDAIIKVSVTLARDGSVISSRIIDSTGSKGAVDSIQRTLNRVTTIGVPFPDGSKDTQRTFTMTFSLKAKKSLG